MEYDGFRSSKDAIGKLRTLIARNASKDIAIMEVCGTHTMAMFRHGIRQFLPECIRLISGPGCPVCVTENRVIDKMIWLAGQEDVVVATFGDMLRVPGSRSSLQKEKGRGARVEIVYSPLLAVDMALQHPDKKIVFISVGFETTTPAIAVAIKNARERKVGNLFVLCANKTVPNALGALASMDHRVDGFLLPGHVSSIIGSRAYGFLAEEHGIPGVIAGFEPLDLLAAIHHLVQMVHDGQCEIRNAYSRVVSEIGNPKAQAVVAEVFEPCDAAWRGLGIIPGSGLRLSDGYLDFDIERRIEIRVDAPKEPEGCICGQILCGTRIPPDCASFRKRCTPEDPVGPCMVSTEGTCAAYYKYQDKEGKGR